MIGFRKHWYGKECEGRLTDIETLFVADIESDFESMNAIHIYFCFFSCGKGTTACYFH